MACRCTPAEVLHMLNKLYLRFDRLATSLNVYKVDTIGDW